VPRARLRAHAADRPRPGADFVRAPSSMHWRIAIGTRTVPTILAQPTGDILAIGRIKEIHRRIPNTHLVMHDRPACRRTCSRRSAR